MPSEPKKPIEEMLEASAKARRSAFGSDPKMPNPMRARLHDEIARLEGAETDEPGKSWLQMFWPRLAFAAALATVLVIGPVMWWQRSQRERSGTMHVAEQRPAAANETRRTELRPEEALAKGPAAETAATPEPTINLADNSRAKIEAATTPAAAADSLGASKRIAEAPTIAPAPMTKGFISEVSKSNQSRSTVAAARPAAPGAAASASEQSQSTPRATVARAGQASAPGASTQRFVQQAAGQAFRNNSQVTQGSNILNSFQVQQEGSEIRVVDSDGSTYTGRVEPGPETTEHGRAKSKRSYAGRVEADNKTSVSQSRFRASGYNVSLKKPLVFEGNYTAPAQQQQQRSANDAVQSLERQEPARIVGTARVHGERPVEVDATAVAQ